MTDCIESLEDYYRENRFVSKLGSDTPLNRVLDYAILNRDAVFDRVAVLEGTGTDEATTRKILEDLTCRGLLSSVLGGYRVNTQHPDIMRLTLLEGITVCCHVYTEMH